MSIASRIQAIEQHLTDDYNVLEVAGADLTNVNKNILNLKPSWQERLLYFINNGTDVVWNNWDKVTGEGTTLTLNNTEEAPMKIVYKGNTYQYSTSGKNLFDESIMPTKTMNGIKWEYTNNKIKISGTSTGTYSQSGNISITLQAGTYFFVKSGTTNLNFNAWFYNTGGTLIANSKLNNPFTISENATRIVLFVEGITSGTSYNQEMNFMVSTTNGEYEPYTNGASPNPDYPQDIHVVSGDNSIVVCGKNLFDKNNPLTDYYYDSNGEQQIVAGWLYNNQEIALSNKYTITFSKKTGSPNVRVIEFGDNDIFIQRTMITTNNTTITINENTTKVIVSIDDDVNNNNYFENLQIEKGNTPTTYEPYIGNTYPVNLPVENLLPNNGTTGTINGVTFTKNADGSVLVNGTATSNTMYYLLSSSENISISAGNYYISGCPSNGSAETYRLVIGVGDTLYGEYGTGRAITISAGVLKSYIYITRGATVNNLLYKPMLEVGTKLNSYTPYGTTPIELCKIGDYQDSIVKDNGKWYLNKQIGKVVLNGSESGWSTAKRVDNTTIFFTKTYNELLTNNTAVSNELSNYFKVGNPYTSYENTIWLYKSGNNNILRIGFSTQDISTLAQFTTWLSTHNTIVYYILATPTTEEITDSTLISQLETLLKARSYLGQTNISQNNDDLPFIINATALKEME